MIILQLQVQSWSVAVVTHCFEKLIKRPVEHETLCSHVIFHMIHSMTNMWRNVYLKSNQGSLTAVYYSCCMNLLKSTQIAKIILKLAVNYIFDCSLTSCLFEKAVYLYAKSECRGEHYTRCHTLLLLQPKAGENSFHSQLEDFPWELQQCCDFELPIVL